MTIEPAACLGRGYLRVDRRLDEQTGEAMI